MFTDGLVYYLPLYIPNLSESYEGRAVRSSPEVAAEKGSGVLIFGQAQAVSAFPALTNLLTAHPCSAAAQCGVWRTAAGPSRSVVVAANLVLFAVCRCSLANLGAVSGWSHEEESASRRRSNRHGAVTSRRGLVTVSSRLETGPSQPVSTGRERLQQADLWTAGGCPLLPVQRWMRDV